MIDARISKGAAQEGNDWICYRKNYITVTCCLHVETQTDNDKFYLRGVDGLEHITHFDVSLSAETLEPLGTGSIQRPAALKQHTPRRIEAEAKAPGHRPIRPMLFL